MKSWNSSIYPLITCLVVVRLKYHQPLRFLSNSCYARRLVINNLSWSNKQWVCWQKSCFQVVDLWPVELLKEGYDWAHTPQDMWSINYTSVVRVTTPRVDSSKACSRTLKRRSNEIGLSEMLWAKEQMQYEITTLTAEVLESSLGKHVSVKIPADEVSCRYWGGTI